MAIVLQRCIQNGDIRFYPNEKSVQHGTKRRFDKVKAKLASMLLTCSLLVPILLSSVHSAVAAPSGDLEVLLFDDFDGTALDTSVWETLVRTPGDTDAGSVAVANGILTVKSGYAMHTTKDVRSLDEFSSSLEVTMRVRRPNWKAYRGYSSGAWGMASTDWTSVMFWLPQHEYDGRDYWFFASQSDGTTYSRSSPYLYLNLGFDPEYWHIYKIVLTETKASYYIDGVLVWESSEGLPKVPLKVFFDAEHDWYRTYIPEGEVQVDWVEVRGVPPVVPATVDIDPDTLNLKSQGRWITAYIELPAG
ncbi:MAG: glycoside hydrolase family 16 protein [Candidatus Zixiibacteriota bacterium]